VNDKPLDVPGAAEALNLCPATVRRLIKNGALPAIRIPGCDRVLIDPRDLRALLDKSRSRTPAVA
jgi:excisionase family DNA binding protein